MNDEIGLIKNMAKLIFFDLYTAVIQFAPYPIISGIVLIAIISVVIKVRYKEPLHIALIHNRNRLGLLYLFYIYCFLIIGITYISREPGSRIGINIEPLSTFSNNTESLKYIIENILLFIPFGFMLPLLSIQFCSFFKCVGAGFVASSMIEISQLLTGRGFFQIDDVIFNVLGCMIGLGLLIGFKNFCSALAKLR